MNNVQKGCSRDNDIVRAVELHGALDTDQITALLFPNMKAGKRKAQHRLKLLVDNKRLNRAKLAHNTPYFYYCDRRSGRLEHLLALNWASVWFRTTLANWDTLIYWGYEEDYKMLRADAFAGLRNNVTGECRFWFIEMDHSGTNPWDKVLKYNYLYEQDRYVDQWWAKKTKRFPAVMCVVEKPERLPIVEEEIANHNFNGLQFRVTLLSDIKKEAVTWGGKPAGR